MFNYQNLNDVEFEELCKDIMGKKLGVPLRTFAKGRDGGVDLTDDVQLTEEQVLQAYKLKFTKPFGDEIIELEIPKDEKLVKVLNFLESEKQA